MRRLSETRTGTPEWFRLIAGVSAGTAAIEVMVAIGASVPQHAAVAVFELLLAGSSLVAAEWQKRTHGSGPTLLVGVSVLCLSIAIAFIFAGSPTAVLLPVVALTFSLPRLNRREIWAFGALATLVSGVTAFLIVHESLGGAGHFGQISSAVVGVVIEGVLVIAFLIRQRAELKDLVTRYTSIVEQVPIGVFRAAPAGQLLDVNAYLADMLGYPTPRDLTAASLRDVVADPSVAASLLNSSDPEEVRAEDVKLRTHGGRTLWASLRLRVVRDNDGRMLWLQGVVRDNTEEHAAMARQARLVAAVEQTAESVVIADARANIVYVNPAFEDATGYTRDEVVGRNPRILQSGEHPPQFYEAMWADLLAGRTWKGELVNRHKNGRLLTEETTITPVLGADGDVSTYVAVKRDVTSQREAEAAQQRNAALRVERLAVADALARLGAKETPAATGEAITSALTRLPGIIGAALIVFDADDEARVLAIDGPSSIPVAGGDRLPVELGRHLRERSARGPWHEPATPSPLSAAYGDAVAAMRLRTFAYAPIGEGDAMIGVLGLGTDDEEYSAQVADHLPTLIDFANAARMLLVDPLLEERKRDESRRRTAQILATGEFYPVFQPVVDLSTGRAVGFEALTRFRDRRRPDLAFADARATGLGIDLEVATLGAALAASVALPDGAWVSLNVSPAMILERERLTRLLASRTRSVVLEVTEHDAIDDYALLRNAFVALGADLRLAVDDAGAGVANFSHIVELRPDFVKVDIGLIRGINADLSRQALVVGLHHFARASNRDVIAEGVETEAELATLRTLDMRFGQGYLLGRPAEAAFWSDDQPTVAPPVMRRGRRDIATTKSTAIGAPA